MTRELFVDTNVLLGLTFYSDRWFREAKPAYENDHEIHTSELVVFEYCSSPHPIREPPEHPQQMDIDWSYDQGLIGRIRSQLSKPFRNFRGKIRRLEDEQLDLENVIELFIDAFEIRKEAEPQIRGKFEEEFSNKAITRQYVNDFASELIDTILRAAEANKAKLSKRVNVHESTYHVDAETKRKWQQLPESPPHEPDLSIIVDGTRVIQNNSVSTILSGDSGLLAVQEIANSYFNFDILSLADEYSVNREETVNT